MRRCDQPAIGLRTWMAALARTGGRERVHPQFRDRRVYGTISGRGAIALTCDVLGLGRGDEILVPSYSCGTELDALLRQGLALRGYPIDRTCRFDLEDIKAR